MKSFNDLLQYYKTTLLPELKVLEKQRIETRNKILYTALIVAPIALLIILLDKELIFFMVILGFIVLAGAGAFFSRKYVSNFKVGIIDKIVEFIDKDLNYSKDGCISQALFVESDIFRHRIDRYRGDDYVSGKLEQTQVKFSEIHAQYITRNSKGRTQHHTIFKGLFFAADFNKAFKGKTIVLPDTAERLFGGLGTMLQSWNKTRGQLIKLEDPEFEKSFAVYGDDQIEARYILSTSLMKRIMDFKKKTNKRIYLSFVNSKLFVAIPYSRNLFEPRIFKTLLDFTPIKQYYEDLNVAVGIVEDLNLNTRIWSKS